MHRLLRRVQKELKLSWKGAVNRALRAGLHEISRPPRRQARYRMKPVSLGALKLGTLDGVAEVLAVVEGEDRR